jgi:hypothetical protein
MKIHFPQSLAEAWRGGFVIASPEHVSSIAAVDGTVVGAACAIYRMRPGETHFQGRGTPAGGGDVTAVAVEPRRRGRASRFACGGYRSLHIYDGEGVASVGFDNDEYGEVTGLLWAPAHDEEDTTQCLHVHFGDTLLRLVDDGKPSATFAEVVWPVRAPCAIARDDAGGFALVEFDEEYWALHVWMLTDRLTNQWRRLSVPAPAFFCGCEIAIADRAAAVSFDQAGVWMTRDLIKHDFREIEELRAPDALKFNSLGGAIAFEGTTADAALFCARMTGQDTQAILRVDAEGRVLHLADVTRLGNTGLEPVRQIAWDVTRRTLWGACGDAGVLCVTAPGAPVPVGTKAAETAAS